jgi:hypothetical protein
MKRSAMLQAFSTLRKKPMVLLLLLPVQFITVLSLKFLPDMSGMLDINNLENLNGSSASAFMAPFMSSFMVYMLISSMISLIALAAMFLLTPPAMELLSDGAADVETEKGWYVRGLRKHWWKPIVASLIVGAITGAIVFIIYIVFVIVSLFATPLLTLGLAGQDYGMNSMNDINSTLGPIMTASTIIGVIFGVILIVPIYFIEAMFATFLPALADRSFGDAFKLTFSKKGFRKVPKAFGGFLLLGLASFIIMAVFIAGYVLIAGIPSEPLAFFSMYMKFFSSWVGVFSFLLVSLTVAIKPAYQFCIYQQIKDEEQTALIKQ